ncbi:Uncharacterized protein PECH_003904 [Penicillium ucsense]|uniref:Ysc84 actin-binding domain-containing protein n=1 Tax=Penicillium ucsense TaxID=2839758 RepID=A0A8J8WK92_9EURO|nr:Uncharacterized protein PECM_005671 [Penicillium ucsense]KAF7737450.1 Uncharacterized protein PECH_003904 [Penicillium ucsense]
MSAWEKTKRFSKKGFDKAWDTVDKLGAPVNRLSNRLGAEAFWPMSIDKESDKAARILRSFCKDGFYAPESEETVDENGKINRPKGKQRVIKKIPTSVIKNAKGLAIFTTMRTGLWVSGSGGSGVLLGRIPETGEWSPPSGIMLHTAGVGFLAGVDIYDCVLVINTYEALAAFKTLRCTLGGEVSAAAGPVGMGGVLESEVHKRQAPIWTYMKSKGLYAGVAIDGTIMIERTDENEKFYGERISVTDILAGKVRHPPSSIKTLIQTIKAAQGDRDVDESLVPPPGQTPGDLEVSSQDDKVFSVPDKDDPDPYGVKALEAEGMFIREAGSKVRPSHEAFEFRPNPSSPLYATFARRSLDSSPRNSWRTSVQSYASVDRGTQTEDVSLTARASADRASSINSRVSASHSETHADLSNEKDTEKGGWDTIPLHGGASQGKAETEEEEKQEKDSQEDVIIPADVVGESIIDDEDDYEVHEVANALVTRPETPNEDRASTEDSRRVSPTFTRAKLVTINKRHTPPVPPVVPPRHPRHTWGSESSRESTSPTALSHTSRSTEHTEGIIEDPEDTSKSTDLDAHPSDAIRTFQTTTAEPVVVGEDAPADKEDEFLSAHSATDDEFEQHRPTESATASSTNESIAAEHSAPAERIVKDDIAGAEHVLGQLERRFPSPQVEDQIEKLKISETPNQSGSPAHL